MEVELQVLREGGGAYVRLRSSIGIMGSDPPLYEGPERGSEVAIKHSLAYIRLEKQNDQLKEALILLVALPISVEYLFGFTPPVRVG